MSKTWFTFAEKLRSCPHSATRTSSPSMKVQHRKKKKKRKIVLCVRADSEPHEEWNVIPGKRLFSISLCLRFSLVTQVFVLKTDARLHKPWSPCHSQSAWQENVLSLVSSSAPYAWWDSHRSESTSVHVFMQCSHHGAPVYHNYWQLGWGYIENIKTCFIGWIWNWMGGFWFFFFSFVTFIFSIWK